MPDDDDAVIEARFVPRLLPPQVALDTAHPGTAIAPAHPEWLAEIAFVCYVKANRRVPAARQLLLTEWEALAPAGEPVIDLPVQTWYSWRRRHEWDAKANQLIATNFPGLRMEQIARLAYAGGTALDALIDAAAGTMPGVKAQDRIKAAEVLLVAAGLGTHGSRDRVAPVVRAVAEQAVNMDDLSEQELARLTMEAIRKSKTDDERRKR
jgi:hypothetical protein